MTVSRAVDRPRSKENRCEARTQADAMDDALTLRAAEAQSLFRLNHDRRESAERVLLLANGLPFAAAFVAIATRRTRSLLPVPAGMLLLYSIAFQHYTEVSVVGVARAQLERLVNAEVESGDVLIYETHVAPIRKRRPLVGSVRALQACGRGLVALSVIAGQVAAAREDPKVEVAYVASISLTGASCLMSYRDMGKAAEIARKALGE